MDYTIAGNQVEIEKKLEEQKVSNAKEFEERRQTALLTSLTNKIISDGFKELTSQEISFANNVMDEIFLSNVLSKEKLELIQTLLSDEQSYRFYSLRSSSRNALQQQAILEAMNFNLADISSKTSGVKMASMFTGMAAVRHLGEEIEEEISGGDNDTGGMGE